MRILQNLKRAAKKVVALFFGSKKAKMK